MRKTIFTNAAALACFAAAGAASGAAAPAAKAGPIVTGIRKASEIKLPERTTKRGSVSVFPFDQLTEAGMSFGLKDRTAKSLSSVVSNQNRRNMTDKKDDAGNIVFKTKTVKDAAGVETVMPTQDAERVAVKRFFAIDVDAKSDPDGASVRVVREL
jgi:hypothetical protein